MHGSLLLNFKYWVKLSDGANAQIKEGGICLMAKTKKGKKIVPVKPYKRRVNGKTIKVRGHRRSTDD